MTPETKQELKQRAEAATPGPWTTWPNCADNGEYCGLDLFAPGGVTLMDEENQPSDNDVLFIAAANPTAILDLLAENERLAAENKSYRNYIASAPDWGGVDYE